MGVEEVIKTGYDPLDDAIEILIQCEDSQLVYDFGGWAMGQDPVRSINIFSSPERKSQLDKVKILSLLEEFGKYYQIQFMSYLIFTDGITEESIHTQMGTYCIDVLQESNQVSFNRGRAGRRRGGRTPAQAGGGLDPIMLQNVESNLMKLLQYSQHYDSAALLGRIQGDSTLFDACIVLYSRVCLLDNRFYYQIIYYFIPLAW